MICGELIPHIAAGDRARALPARGLVEALGPGVRAGGEPVLSDGEANTVHGRYIVTGGLP
jgi:hypothetical protein